MFQVFQAVSASPKFSVAKERVFVIACNCLCEKEIKYYTNSPTNTHTHGIYFYNEFNYKLCSLFFISDHQTSSEENRWSKSTGTFRYYFSSGCSFTLAHITSCVWQGHMLLQIFHHHNMCIRSQEWFIIHIRKVPFPTKAVIKHEKEVIHGENIPADASVAVVQVPSSDSVPQRISGAKLYLYVQIILVLLLQLG